MKHTGISTRDGPEEKTGVMRLQLSPSLLMATLSVAGVDCTFSGKLADSYRVRCAAPIESRSHWNCGSNRRSAHGVRSRRQGESLPLPVGAAVPVGDPLIEAKRLDIVERRGVEAEMALKQRAAQAAGDGGVPD